MTSLMNSLSLVHSLLVSIIQLLLLHPSWLLASIQASNHVGSARVFHKVSVLPLVLLGHEVVGGCDLVVPVGLNALH